MTVLKFAWPRSRKMSEKRVEYYLREQVHKHGGIALKNDALLRKGIPDRLVLMPGGWACFVELKAPGKKPTELQMLVMGQLDALGHRVCWIDSKVGVDVWLEWYHALDS